VSTHGLIDREWSWYILSITLLEWNQFDKLLKLLNEKEGDILRTFCAKVDQALKRVFTDSPNQSVQLSIEQAHKEDITNLQRLSSYLMAYFNWKPNFALLHFIFHVDRDEFLYIQTLDCSALLIYFILDVKTCAHFCVVWDKFLHVQVLNFRTLSVHFVIDAKLALVLCCRKLSSHVQPLCFSASSIVYLHLCGLHLIFTTKDCN